MDFLEIVDDAIIWEENEIGLFRSRKKKVVRKRPNHFIGWEDEEFRKRFRLKKTTVEYLLALIADKIQHKTERNQCVPPLFQLLIALRFYATGSFYISIGDFAGIDASRVCVIIKKVTEAIASLRPFFIKMPTNENEILVQQAFYKVARFPRVIAAIDCTHVRIISPGGETAENFRNRKGYFSMNVQALSSSDLKLQDVVARWPGSTHDSLIFANSAINYRLDSGHFKNGILLGDSGYSLNSYLMTPLHEPHTRAECLYNESHIRTRNAIERCFGVWKRRFPVLSIGMRCNLPLVQDIIVATAVLHNLAIEQKDEEPPDDPEIVVEIDEFTDQHSHDIQTQNQTRHVLLDYFGSLL